MTPTLPAARAALLQRAHAVQGMDASVGIPSPCVSVCNMDARSGLCQGCLRTLNEIGQWSVATDVAKQHIWRAIAQRILSNDSPLPGDTA